jgi:hypothetical protein
MVYDNPIVPTDMAYVDGWDSTEMLTRSIDRKWCTITSKYDMFFNKDVD